MKIVIATPLYPPDIGDPAPYVKELAKRLAENDEVTVVSYGRLPEKVFGASFVSIEKRHPLPLRLLRFTIALFRATRKADVLYAENGASVELPAGIVALLTKKPLVLHIGDKVAQDKAESGVLLRSIHTFAHGRARKVIQIIPKTRPEILPFTERPDAEFDAYERSWNTHIHELEEIFTHGT
ncbi:MAG: hypothetical protein A2494_02595 [Candidatus Lloydbacteria bacterium RIFOXYC12_FULL_46_25]|uniref:Glycosyltransferase subfamily 4-like N-terminal domain-containing protein n=1 Tax=Candidatus Lloydbacteria bacterium RIFOXYC12_FULL_46_25 TaxID=1798670 RepID=A0A1G2DY92_9BACT|nr:MAG: hypothetical protein A2494_02595 [Candidatus Lloydbacteria bacterium RIFOXYC12_FULL_46_25]